MNFRIQRFESCDSTNERAFAALAAGEGRHGDVFVSANQTAGRGRLGRSWHSTPGAGLYLSLLVKPTRPFHPGMPLALTMASGVAVLGLARGLGLQGAQLKWPNDVLVGGAKLAGILVESRAADPRQPCFVVGIGVNVSQTGFAPELLAERAVTSLLLCGAKVSVAEAERRLLKELDGRLELALGDPQDGAAGPQAVAVEYARELGLLGQSVEVELAHSRVQGRLLRLGLDSLELADEGGPRRFALAHLTGLRALPAGL
jgi:BirA family transcriptional regulator, biotin operon repressor / biotin---[acetyl-CoA-carboxylase] ligase